jgi:hypothetical protein
MNVLAPSGIPTRDHRELPSLHNMLIRTDDLINRTNHQLTNPPTHTHTKHTLMISVSNRFIGQDILHIFQSLQTNTT